MKCQRNAVFTIIAICLITIATHAQRRSQVLRFRAPFPFTTENMTFKAGEYEVTQPGLFILTLRNVENQASAMEHVLPTGSSKVSDGQPRAIFHRYGKEYLLAVISDGSWQSTYELGRSSKEQELANKNPTRQEEVVSRLSNDTVVTAKIDRK